LDEVIAGRDVFRKSEELVRRVRRAVIARKHVQVFKSISSPLPGLYTVSTARWRYGGSRARGFLGRGPARRAARTEVVTVDEVQFLDDGIVAVANGLADRGVRIVLAGIDMDFRRPAVRPIPHSSPSRDRRQLQAICSCAAGRRPATRSRERTAGAVGKPDHHGGGRESYEARLPPLPQGAEGDEEQTALL